MRFVVSASRREKSMQQLCEEFQISRPTGYQWLRRYQGGGMAGVVEKSRRPHHSPETDAGGDRAAGHRTAPAAAGLGSAEAAGYVGAGKDSIFRRRLP